ncbi:hypothetical protein PZN02_006125 (plasmid) [Sinorhizobium garamanticum]|uniref:Tyr recombinase domain-containing protein n=1 Tax=Sinorhizobium garamanticum TaxID=680247 RepID=A0ABY8DSE4_9HYPH|nr:hypothetical protein [Sinorhizobium garamanticum]WEX91798.1 hypothetical protein PZN02_006125 [Sinorhizobium garamanticum]
MSFSERVLRRFNGTWGCPNRAWCVALQVGSKGVGPRTEVPAAGLICGKKCRSRPYIYTPDQIAAIVAEAARLPSSYGLRVTSSTLFALIAVTGLRVSEAIGLDEGRRVDAAVLTVRGGKNAKSRFCPDSEMRRRPATHLQLRVGPHPWHRLRSILPL